MDRLVAKLRQFFLAAVVLGLISAGLYLSLNRQPTFWDEFALASGPVNSFRYSLIEPPNKLPIFMRRSSNSVAARPSDWFQQFFAGAKDSRAALVAEPVGE